jgi:UDP-3-O-[3-hydroxymyristoyl] glucosamine N-acyltransferase
MKVTLETVAKAIDGTIVGDGSIEITGCAGIREARAGELTFLAHPRYEEYLEHTQASAVIVAENHRHTRKTLVQNSNPYLAYLKAVRFFQGEACPPTPGIHASAVIAATAKVDPTAQIGPHVVLEGGASIGPRTAIQAGCYVGADASVGSDCTLYPNVTVREGCEIKDRVIVHSSTVIGSDGFGFIRDGAAYCKLPQVGNVVVEDDVELGACVTIDRATTGTTRIGAGSKIDNLVQIAHNVQVGRNCIIVAQVGISGSTILRDDVTLAGQVGVVGHIEIGRGRWSEPSRASPSPSPRARRCSAPPRSRSRSRSGSRPASRNCPSSSRRCAV